MLRNKRQDYVKPFTIFTRPKQQSGNNYFVLHTLIHFWYYYANCHIRFSMLDFFFLFSRLQIKLFSTLDYPHY